MVEKYTGTRIIGIPTSQYKLYALAKAKEIVSWKPVEERATQPFERMQWDRFHHTKALDGLKYTNLFRCEASGYTIPKFLISKLGLLKTI